MVHIIPDQVVAAAQLDKRERIGIHRADPHPAVVGGLLPAAELAGGERVPVIGQLPAVGGGAGHQVGPDRRVVALGVKHIMRGKRQRRGAGGPGRIRVSGKHRQYLIGGNPRAGGRVPAGHGIVGDIKAGFHRDLFERCQVGGVIHKFVFKLNADDRPAVLIEEPLHLRENRGVPAPHKRQIGRVVAAQRNAFAHQPVRKAAVAAFAVRPGADAQHNRKPGAAAVQDKTADIKVAGKAAGPFDFLMVNPEQIGGGDGHAAGLHLGKFGRPGFGFAAGKVELPHHRQKRLAGAGQVPVGQVQPDAGRVGAAPSSGGGSAEGLPAGAKRMRSCSWLLSGGMWRFLFSSYQPGRASQPLFMPGC